MTQVLADLFYLPNLEFFTAVISAEKLMLSPADLYQRKSYFNRTHILLSNKVELLSIPIQGRRPKVPSKDIRIDYQQKWMEKHLRGIQSAYGKAPFFEYFWPEFFDAFEEKPAYLWDLNVRLLTICLRLLQLPAKLVIVENPDDLEIEKDIRGLIMPSGHFSERNFYEPAPYPQLFGLDFEPNLSILDLLFCEGPNAKSQLYKSIKKQ